MNTSENMPEIIGRYHLGPEIGRGSMATVYRAFDLRLQRKVAIKLLRPRFAREERYRQDFLTEAHAAGRLTHPGIVTIHDVGAYEGTPFIAMELLHGRTLQGRVDEKGAMRAAEVVDIAIQLARALDYAHRKGVVHRDVKADNVMQSRSGAPKLTDFGIAKLRQPDAGTVTTEETIVGTPNYMAPEQVAGGEVDGRADLYALGILMYFLLTARLPFASDSPVGTLESIMNDPAPALRPRDAATPRVLIELVHTLMAKDPAKRYQTGAELADELAQIQREMESMSPSRWRMPLTVRWPAVMGLAVAVTLVVGAAIVYRYQRAAMTEVVFDYGASMVDTIGSDAAEDLLLGDYVAVQAMVVDMQQHRQMAYLRIADRDGKVIASSRQEEVGAAQQDLAEKETLVKQEGVRRVARYSDAEGEYFLFEAPVIYGDQRIGDLTLGISREPLNHALTVSLLAMLSLMVATVITVMAVMWVLSWRLRVPLRLLGRGLDRAARGDLDHRIRVQRQDELGELFARFNIMAEALARRRRGARARDAEPESGSTRRLTVVKGRDRKS